METALPPPIPPTPVQNRFPTTASRRNTVTLKLLFIAGLVLLLQLPLGLINQLRQERSRNRESAYARQGETIRGPENATRQTYDPARAAAEGYRMVERTLKHSPLVLTLVFAAFFLFETLAGLRLHAVHYILVGAALCLFYLALLTLGELMPPGPAYVVAAAASSLLVVCYSISILHSYVRAASIAAFLLVEHSVLYVVLRMEDFALLAGTASLFVVLAAIMFFTRKVDWFAQETGAKSSTP